MATGRTWCLPFKAEMLRLMFAPEDGETPKTVTRRRWKTPRVKVGGIYPVGPGLVVHPVGWVRVETVTHEVELLAGADNEGGARMLREARPETYEELIGTLAEALVEWLDEEARLEGFANMAELASWWADTYGEAALTEPCWRVGFRPAGHRPAELARALEGGKR